ncbi:hypothetical protein KD27_05490, partial [Smithella sp. D17]
MDYERMTGFYQQFKAFFQAEDMNHIAKQIGWFHRQRKLTAFHLVLALLAAMLATTAKTITQLQGIFAVLTAQSISYQPFYDKLRHPQCAVFFQHLLRLLLSRWSLQVLAPSKESKLSNFEDILIQDGSSLRLHRDLAGVYPGRWDHSPAAVEIHLTYSLFQEKPVRLVIAPDKFAEKHYLLEACKAKGKLILLDRGYFDRHYVAQVKQAGGDVLVRAKSNLNPRIVGLICDGKHQPIAHLPLKSIRSQIFGKNIDAIVRWKDLDFDFRLLGLWNPKTNVHIWLLTTLGMDWEATEIGQLFRLRWQVELCFKE